MKILLMSGHMNAGGITSYTLTLARGLKGKGAEVFIVSSGGDLVPEIKKTGAKYFPLNVRFKFEFHPRLLSQLPKLCRHIREEKIDIIHAHTRATSMLAALASHLTGRPYVTTCHGYFSPHFGRRILPLWGRKAIAISPAVRIHLLKDFGLKEKNVALVPNGIDNQVFKPFPIEARYQLRERWKIGREPVVGIIARLSDVKGHVFLIEAMAEVKKSFPDVKCLIFGEGPQEKVLKALSAAKKVDDAVFFYPVSHKTQELLGLLDIFVMPSISEGLGLSVMEAQSSGLPVVVSAVGGLCDIVQEGETGYLVASEDVGALAEAIIKVLKDPVKAKEMGARARAFITEHYSVEHMVAGTLGVYEDVIQSCGPKKL
ncbi:MAG: glycosyltransferase family 4 protein [Candidatus Omnitrophica bacterium]|nr:glycosyltransferase family 4 protein [Candidatus Omnitrophota bacterium]